MVQGSFPDIKVVIDDIHTDGNSVILAIHFKATFTHPLDLSVLGLGVIPATGAPVKFLINTNRFSFEGDKIERMYNMDIGPYTGVSGFLKDVSVPISQDQPVCPDLLCKPNPNIIGSILSSQPLGSLTVQTK